MTIKVQGLAVLLAAGVWSGCAATVPDALAQARVAYTRASTGLPSALAPTEVYDAKKVLDRANQEFDEHGDTVRVHDYAYIAFRKVELAEVKARTEQDRQNVAAAVAAGAVVRDEQAKRTLAELTAAREQIKDDARDHRAEVTQLQAENAAQSKELWNGAERLDTERQARLGAERKLEGAMRDLSSIAAVKEDARGVVITLSGSILFVSGKYALLETAQTKLDQVATAIMAQSSEKRMVVEGHTDSQGSDAVNEPLSLNRANAVRAYLIGRGVASERISAVGMGSTKPLANNNTAENRANNRRVEIVIETPVASGG